MKTEETAKPKPVRNLHGTVAKPGDAGQTKFQEIGAPMSALDLQGSVLMPRLLTPREAAQTIHKSEKWLEADRRNGPTVPYVKIGRSVRYRGEVLRDLVLVHEVPAVSE